MKSLGKGGTKNPRRCRRRYCRKHGVPQCLPHTGLITKPIDEKTLVVAISVVQKPLMLTVSSSFLNPYDRSIASSRLELIHQVFPYINLEDLASTSLTLFINSRGLNPPSAFARADLLAINLGSISHSIPEPAFLGGYTLCLEGSTVEEYGKFLDWDVDPEQATTLMVHRRHFTPGEGLQVLEIQERIYPFLIQCCEIVLHDLKSEGSLLDEKYPVLEQAPLSSIQALPSNDGNILPALSTISQEAPYRLPAQLDLDRLKGIFAAKRSAASDHLWAMREDPGYFAEEIKDWSEHRNDRLPDTNGQPHPTGPHTIDFWHRVIRNVISEAVSGLLLIIAFSGLYFMFTLLFVPRTIY